MSNEVIIELFGEHSHVHVSEVPENIQVKILNFPFPTQSRVIYSDLSAEYLNPGEIFSSSRILSKPGTFAAIFPERNLKLAQFRRISGINALDQWNIKFNVGQIVRRSEDNRLCSIEGILFRYLGQNTCRKYYVCPLEEREDPERILDVIDEVLIQNSDLYL